MNFLSIRSHFVRFQNSVNTFALGCCTNQRCQVHPEISNGDDIDFVHLGSQRTVRVIHLSPNSKRHCLKPVVLQVSQKGNHKNDIPTNLDITSEEYWFTVSNRPFRPCDDCHRVSTSYAGKEFPNTSAGLRISKELNEVATSASCHPVILTEHSLNNIEKFADFFSQEVMKGVFHRMITILPDNGDVFSEKNAFASRMLILDDEHYYNFKGRIEDKLINGNSSLFPDIASKCLKYVGEAADVEPVSNHEEAVCDTTSGVCASGFVNHSFSGSLTEPDQTDFNYTDSVCNDTSGVNGQTFGEFEKSIPILGKVKDACSKTSSLSTESRNIANCTKNVLSNKVGVRDLPFVYMDPKDVFQATPSELIVNKDLDQNEPFAAERESKECPRHYVQPRTNDRVNNDTCTHTKGILKPILLFLHGVGSSADIWSVLLDYFSSAGYEVLAPDMLGHGYSTAPDDCAAYTFERLLEDVLHVFDRFVSDHQRCVVIGHSYGSCFAAALARYRPQQIAQLVLLSSGGPSPLVPKQSFSIPPLVITLMKPFLMCGFKRELFYSPRGKHLPSFCTYELPPYVLKHVECGQEWSDGDSAFHRRILVPTLLVHGLKDPYISLVEECEMERTIPRSFLEVLPNCGHMVMLDAPEQLCHMIHCFVTWWDS